MSKLFIYYMKHQRQHLDAFVLLRLGDFYEVMGEKAKEAAELLDLTLTGRDVGEGERVPMVGFPVSVAEQYIEKLLTVRDVVKIEDEGRVEVVKKPEEQKPLNDHSARAHALLSASSAARWLTCPPSAVAAEAYPNQETEFTKEGTLAHEVAEFVARGALGIRGQFPDATAEMVDCAQDYTAYIEEQKTDNDALVLLEQRVDFSPWVPDGFGTCDCIIIHGDTLTIIDYKYGVGVAVSAKDNPQMKLYALGALNDYGIAYDVKKVEMHIFQPRINNVSADSLTVDELMTWAEKTVKPIAQKAAKGKGTYQPSEHCKFCPHAGKCRALTKLCTEYVETHSLRVAVPVLAPHEVAEVLAMEPIISLWMKRVKDQAMTTMMNGGEVPGWKIVEGRQGLRKWNNELKVVETLKAAGFNWEEFTKTELLSPAAMDKAIGKKKVAELLPDFIDRAAGAPVIAPESDKRPTFNRLAEAQKDFE